jgi:predicted patatin/cPLA2 family phospholipase
MEKIVKKVKTYKTVDEMVGELGSKKFKEEWEKDKPKRVKNFKRWAKKVKAKMEKGLL